ncbi:MAG: glycosyltransferase family 4 protein [Rhodocyclaceae bacterium]|nr:glycosyltransferase family 4 protein [Rhodocyclaceae bacterium]
MKPASASPLIHVVAASPAALGGAELHALQLVRLLATHAATHLWATNPSAPRIDEVPIRTIHPFRGEFPRGGTLIILGNFFSIGDWVHHTGCRRVIVVCNLSDPARLFRLLRQLDHPKLPDPELAFVTDRLRLTLGLPGRVIISPVDTDLFRPGPVRETNGFCVGRHSRDTPDKHHPDDPSLYRMLTFAGCKVRVMGGTCLAASLARDAAGIELLPEESGAASEFLRSLDCFFYRTAPSWSETGGRVILEALSSGLPVVAHAAGGYTDWIENGRNGYIFESQEEAFDLVMRLRKDAALRQSMAAAARQSALELSGADALKPMLDWYLA